MLALAGACALAGCATERMVPGEPLVVTGQGLPPYHIHEECVRLVPGDRLEFRFEATAPLDFAIYYRDGRAVVMPWVRDKVLEDAGVFTPRTGEAYCLMWEAGPVGTLLDYRIRLRPAGS
jgi:hypothetical protein